MFFEMMDSDEFARRAKALAEEMSSATSRWEARAEKLQKDLQRAQRKLQQIRLEHKQRLDALWAAYSSEGPPPVPTPAQEPALRIGTRKRRGSMDAPLLQLIREQFHDGDFTVHDVVASWKAQNPMDNVSVSTIRGVLNRHVTEGRLREVEKGGRGHGNLERFALEPETQDDDSSLGGATAELAH